MAEPTSTWRAPLRTASPSKPAAGRRGRAVCNVSDTALRVYPACAGQAHMLASGSSAHGQHEAAQRAPNAALHPTASIAGCNVPLAVTSAFERRPTHLRAVSSPRSGAGRRGGRQPEPGSRQHGAQLTEACSDATQVGMGAGADACVLRQTLSDSSHSQLALQRVRLVGCAGAGVVAQPTSCDPTLNLLKLV